jgi:membrane-associated protein
MFEQFTHLVAQASGWAYVIVLIFAVIDALLPVVPSETAVITAGVVGASGDLFLPLVIAAAAAGAFLGDNLAYGTGRRYGSRARDRFFDGDKARRRIEWAKRHLDRRGGELIAVARFIPGGRTAVTLTAGLTQFPWRRFAAYDAGAATIWASYAALLGYFGGRAFEHQAWKGLLLALAIAFTVSAAIEAVRWALRRRSGKTRVTVADVEPTRAEQRGAATHQSNGGNARAASDRADTRRSPCRGHR